MKRDWHLLGEIFDHIEQENIESFIKGQSDPEQERILLHMELLADAGHIKGFTLRRTYSGQLNYGFEGGGVRITLQGYDFADIVQDHKLLNKTISLIEKAGFTVTWETLKHFAPVALEQAIKILSV